MPDNAYISQVVEEVLYSSESTARISQLAVEVIYNSLSAVRISQLAVEVLRTVDADVSFQVSVTNTLTATQTIRPSFTTNLNVANTFTATQTIVSSRPIINVNYESTLIATQGNSSEISFLFTVDVTNTLTASQSNSIVFVRGFLVFVNNTASANQAFKILSPLVVTVTNSALVSQVVVGVNATFYVTASGTANVTQIAFGKNSTFTIVIDSTANVHQNFIRRDLTFIVSLGNTFTVRQRINKDYEVRVSSTADITQTSLTKRFTSQIIIQTGILTDIFDYTRSPDFIIEDPQTLLDSYTHSGNYKRNFSHQQTLKDTYRSALVSNFTGQPSATGTPIISPTQTTIESLYGSIILPAAEYGDTFNAKVVNTIKRSMTGKIYTYIRTNASDKFTLTWVLSYAKALEFEAYFKNNLNHTNLATNYYTLGLWNGDIWQAKLISIEMPQTFEGRWQNTHSLKSDVEKVTVTASFEGVQIL